MVEENELNHKGTRPSAQVLIVEDDPAINTLLAMTLEEAGYSVNIAWNGLEALEYLQQITRPPVLILLDLTMPVMNGRQFLEQLKGFKPANQNLPVVVLTASREQVVVDGETGIVGYLSKPFDLDELMSWVERFVQVQL